MRPLLKICAIFVLGMVITACNKADKRTMETSKQEIDSIPEAQVSKEPSTIFKNEYASVFLETLEPGQQQTEHEGVSRVTYSLNGYLTE